MMGGGGVWYWAYQDLHGDAGSLRLFCGFERNATWKTHKEYSIYVVLPKKVLCIDCVVNLETVAIYTSRGIFHNLTCVPTRMCVCVQGAHLLGVFTYRDMSVFAKVLSRFVLEPEKTLMEFHGNRIIYPHTSIGICHLDQPTFRPKTFNLNIISKMIKTPHIYDRPSIFAPSSYAAWMAHVVDAPNSLYEAGTLQFFFWDSIIC